MSTMTGLRARRFFAGEIAKEVGVGVQTLHFYERRGLIAPPPRSEAGYRLYPAETLERVRFIRKAQALGLALDEIKGIFELASQGASPCGRVQTSLAGKLQQVDDRLAELRGFRAELAKLVRQAKQPSTYSAEAQVCSIVEEAAELPRAEWRDIGLSAARQARTLTTTRRFRPGASTTVGSPAGRARGARPPRA